MRKITVIETAEELFDACRPVRHENDHSLFIDKPDIVLNTKTGLIEIGNVFDTIDIAEISIEDFFSRLNREVNDGTQL